MSKKRKQHSPEFKAKVALAAIKNDEKMRILLVVDKPKSASRLAHTTWRHFVMRGNPVRKSEQHCWSCLMK